VLIKHTAGGNFCVIKSGLLSLGMDKKQTPLQILKKKKLVKCQIITFEVFGYNQVAAPDPEFTVSSHHRVPSPPRECLLLAVCIHSIYIHMQLYTWKYGFCSASIIWFPFFFHRESGRPTSLTHPLLSTSGPPPLPTPYSALRSLCKDFVLI